MQLAEFSEEQWQEVFYELRLLVQRVGYGDWDRATMDSLSDEIEGFERSPFDRRGLPPPHTQLQRYTRELIDFLKLRSKPAREKQRTRLNDFLRAESGASVSDVRVDFEGHDLMLYESDDDPDAMIAELKTFLDEISGENTEFWRDVAAEDEEEGRAPDADGDA